MNNKKYLVEIPIIRKNFNKTKSAKFKGKIMFVSNSYGIIYNWKAEFTEVFIDLFTTPLWFNDRNPSFKRRQLLFKDLNFAQKPRPFRENNILKLNDEKLLILNNFINDRNKYNSTLKNLIPLLKGNNPGGEVKKPWQAEMLIDTKTPDSNFVLLFDDLVMKNKIQYDVVSLGAEKISFEEFIRLNESLSSGFRSMQKSKTYKEWIHYSNGIKKFYSQYNIDFSYGNRIAEKARSKFSTKIKNEITKFPFNFLSSDQFQKCHIYEFHDLRDKIIDSIRNNKSYEKYVNMILDHNNFLPLPNYIHRKFDLNWFTYKMDGSIYAINKKGHEFINSYVKDVYKKIPDWFMTKERKKYFQLRNKNISWI